MSARQSPTTGFLSKLGSFYAADVVAMIGHLLVTPWLLAYLGDEQYGLLAISAAFVGYLGLLSLGLKPALTRFVAAAAAKDDDERLGELMSSSLATFLVLGILGLGAAAVVSRFVGPIFKVPDALVAACAMFLLIKGVEFAISLILGTFEATNYGLDRILVMNGLRGLFAVLNYVGAILVIALDLGFVALAVVGVIAALTSGLLQRKALRDARPHLRWRLGSARVKTIKELVSYGFFFALDGVVVLLVFKTDELVIGTVLGVGAVAIYAILNQAIQSILALVLRISATLYPAFSALAATEKRDELRKIFCRAMDGSLLVAGGLCIVLCTFGTALAQGWLSTDEIPQGVVLALAAVIIAHTPVSLASKYVAAVGLLPKLAVISIIEGVTNLGLSLALIHRWGLTGVAIATLVAQLATTTWFNPRLACRHMELPFGAFVVLRVGRLLTACLPTGAAAAALWYFLRPLEPLEAGVGALACLALHALVGRSLWRRWTAN